MRALRGRLAYAGGVATLAGLLAFAVAIPSADADGTTKPCGTSSPIGEQEVDRMLWDAPERLVDSVEAAVSGNSRR